MAYVVGIMSAAGAVLLALCLSLLASTLTWVVLSGTVRVCAMVWRVTSTKYGTGYAPLEELYQQVLRIVSRTVGLVRALFAAIFAAYTTMCEALQKAVSLRRGTAGDDGLYDMLLQRVLRVERRIRSKDNKISWLELQLRDYKSILWKANARDEKRSEQLTKALNENTQLKLALRTAKDETWHARTEARSILVGWHGLRDELGKVERQYAHRECKIRKCFDKFMRDADREHTEHMDAIDRALDAERENRRLKEAMRAQQKQHESQIAVLLAIIQRLLMLGMLVVSTLSSSATCVPPSEIFALVARFWADVKERTTAALRGANVFPTIDTTVCQLVGYAEARLDVNAMRHSFSSFLKQSVAVGLRGMSPLMCPTTSWNQNRTLEYTAAAACTFSGFNARGLPLEALSRVMSSRTCAIQRTTMSAAKAHRTVPTASRRQLDKAIEQNVLALLTWGRAENTELWTMAPGSANIAPPTQSCSPAGRSTQHAGRDELAKVSNTTFGVPNSPASSAHGDVPQAVKAAPAAVVMQPRSLVRSPPRRPDENSVTAPPVRGRRSKSTAKERARTPLATMARATLPLVNTGKLRLPTTPLAHVDVNVKGWRHRGRDL